MLVKALLLFTLVPLIEVWLLVRLGQGIGTAPTIFVVAITGFVGVLLAKSQGFLVIRRLQNKLATGTFPTDEIYNGACVLVGGTLLLTPGIMTDVFGISLLIPVTRYLWKNLFANLVDKMMKSGNFKIYSHHYNGSGNFKSTKNTDYYDADFDARYEDDNE